MRSFTLPRENSTHTIQEHLEALTKKINDLKAQALSDRAKRQREESSQALTQENAYFSARPTKRSRKLSMESQTESVLLSEPENMFADQSTASDPQQQIDLLISNNHVLEKMWDTLLATIFSHQTDPNENTHQAAEIAEEAVLTEPTTNDSFSQSLKQGMGMMMWQQSRPANNPQKTTYFPKSHLAIEKMWAQFENHGYLDTSQPRMK